MPRYIQIEKNRPGSPESRAFPLLIENLFRPKRRKGEHSSYHQKSRATGFIISNLQQKVPNKFSRKNPLESHIMRNNSKLDYTESVLKGHDFSRAEEELQISLGFSPREMIAFALKTFMKHTAGPPHNFRSQEHP
jgi:arginine deiminase